MKHPGHTYRGFVSAISERGMTPGERQLGWLDLAGLTSGWLGQGNGEASGLRMWKTSKVERAPAGRCV
jgi:hypothetical protein